MYKIQLKYFFKTNKFLLLLICVSAALLVINKELNTTNILLLLVLYTLPSVYLFIEYLFYSMNNIFFDMSKASLRTESFIELDKLSRILQENSTMEIEIDGHTDNVGDAALNLQLSIERANTVRNYLIQKGIVHTRVIAKGFGGTKPVASNDTEETKKLNRRVEFTIIKI